MRRPACAFLPLFAVAACGGPPPERKPLAQTTIVEDAGAPAESKPPTPCELVERRALACPAEPAIARSADECEQRIACLGEKVKVQPYLDCVKTNAAECAKACDAMAVANKDALVRCGVIEPPTKVEAGAQKPARSLGGPSCPSKATKGSMSALAMKTCSKNVRDRAKVVSEIRQIEQGLAGPSVTTKQQALLTWRLANEYAELECILSTECLKGKPDALTGEIPFSEARQQTETHCATMRSQFPKFAGRCP